MEIVHNIIATLIVEVIFEQLLICTAGLNIAENKGQWLLHLLDGYFKHSYLATLSGCSTIQYT